MLVLRGVRYAMVRDLIDCSVEVVASNRVCRVVSLHGLSLYGSLYSSLHKGVFIK